jgi:hypothetical protein
VVGVGEDDGGGRGHVAGVDETGRAVAGGDEYLVTLAHGVAVDLVEVPCEARPPKEDVLDVGPAEVALGPEVWHERVTVGADCREVGDSVDADADGGVGELVDPAGVDGRRSHQEDPVDPLQCGPPRLRALEVERDRRSPSRR